MHEVLLLFKKYLENLFYEIFSKMFSNDKNYRVTL